MDTQHSQPETLRLNQHGKPFVRQGFSQLIHTMREAFKACQAKSVPCLIHLEFRTDARGQGGVFEVLGKPTRTGENCTALVRRHDTVEESFTLSWTPSNENEIVWNRRKAERGPRKIVIQVPADDISVPSEVPETLAVPAEMAMVTEPENQQEEPAVALEAQEEEVPAAAPVLSKEERLAMLKAAHARVRAARAVHAA